VVLEISKNQFDVEHRSQKISKPVGKFHKPRTGGYFIQTSMCNPERVMDWVISLSMMPVI